MRSATKPRVAVTVFAVFAGLAGCGTRPPPGLLDGGGVPNVTGVCQHTCTPDPGAPLVDCAAVEANYEFASPAIWDFEGGNATALYSYTDNTANIATFFAPDNQRPGQFQRKTWEPPTTKMARCSNPANPSNGVVHIQGGPFLGWGGGVGTAMKDYPGRASMPVKAGTPATIAGAALDASAWEGISFWARRGPDSQVGFRVLAGDKNTDDDISYLMYHADPTTPRFCERVRECACLNHQICQDVAFPTVQAEHPECAPAALKPATMSFCGEPAPMSAGQVGAGTSNIQCNTCLKSRCDDSYPAYPADTATPNGEPNPEGGSAPAPQGTDRQFFGKPCMPFIFRNGISSSYCFDPAQGETPADPTEQCGDHWTKTVNLSTDWQFYTVPFNEMLQQGWAKRFAAMDVTAVSVVRFTWDGGWIDFYVDDVRFYRRRK